jgi:hypothetical protein
LRKLIGGRPDRGSSSVFVAILSHVLAPAADSLETVAGIFELRLKSPMNLVKRDIFSAEKSNNHSLLVAHSAK